MTYAVDRARRLIVVEGHEVITMGEVAALRAELLAQDLVGYSALVDLTGATTDIMPDELRTFMVRRRVQPGPGPAAGLTAIVATDDALFGMARMFQALGEDDGRFYAARTRAEAEAWLDGRQLDT